MSLEGHLVLASGATFEGQLRGGQTVEINGHAEGTIVTSHVVIGESGAFKGSIKAHSAEIRGQLRGEAAVRDLLIVRASGDVEGRIEYGQLALESGSNFVAEVRNIPPELAGDFEMNVERGGQVAITPTDLKATDADDAVTQLTFTASNVFNGHLARAEAPATSIATFTQAEINAATIIFVHSGADSRNAGFDVMVADSDGATAGPARPILVRVA